MFCSILFSFLQKWFYSQLAANSGVYLKKRHHENKKTLILYRTIGQELSLLRCHLNSFLRMHSYPVLTYRFCCNVQSRLAYSKVSFLSVRPLGSIPCSSYGCNSTICSSLGIFQTATRPGQWFVTN